MALQRGDGVLTIRRLWRYVRWTLLAVLAVLVLVVALLSTAPGHSVVRRIALSSLGKVVNGRVQIGSIGGALWRHVVINDLEIDDSAGHPVIQLAQVSVRFNPIDLVNGAFRFSSVTLVRPVINLDVGADGKLNLEKLFRSKTPADSAKKGPRPLIDLNDVALVQGTVRLTTHPRANDATDDLRELDHLTADLTRLRLSHPDSAALLAGIRRLAGDLSNPQLHLQHLDGEVSLSGDTLHVDVDHVTLPGTRATVAGQFRLGGKNLALDLAVNAAPVAFADLRGLVKELPDTGGGDVAAMIHLAEDGNVEADVRHADIRSGRSVITGRGILHIRPDGGGSARGVDVELKPLDFALVQQYTGDLPVAGLINGSIKGGGDFRDLTFDAKALWTDEKTEGHPINTLDGAGRLLVNTKTGADFRNFTLRDADLDFGSIRQFAPSVKLAGRLRAAGTLEGPWRDAQFNGALLHYADSNQASLFRGAVKLGIHDTVGVDAVVVIDSLSLDLLRRTYPQIPMTGQLHGRAEIHGLVDSMQSTLALAGSAGQITAQGMIGLRDSASVLRLTGTFDSLNLHGLRDYNPNSLLAGNWWLDLVSPSDSLQPSVGTARLNVAGANVAGVALGPGTVAVRLEPGRIAIDTATLAFTGGGLTASGAIGREHNAPGTLDFTLHADTVGYLEPLLRWMVQSGDSGDVKLDGKASVNGRIEGTTAAWTLTSDAALDGVTVTGDFGRKLRLVGTVHGDSTGMTVAAQGSADSIAIGSLGYRPVALSVNGRLDSLSIGAALGFAGTSQVRALITTWADSVRRTVRIDTLALQLPAHSWALTEPATVRFGNGRLVMDTLDFRPSPAGGFVRAAGTLTRHGEADFFFDADSLPLEDIYAILQQDTSGIQGAFSADARITGAATTPAMVLSVELENGRIGDYTLPRVFVQGDYHDKLITLTGGLWRDSVRIVSLNGTAPLDLSLTQVDKREIAGPIDITAQADSLDMRAFNALASTVTDVSGKMALNVHALGTWAAPNLSGFVDISNGAVRVPSIGANYNQIDLRLEAPGDSTLRVVRGTMRAGGTLGLAGRLSFNRGLTHPDVAMRLDANSFNAFDIPGFGALTATGKDSLGGPLIGARLTGTLVADRGTLQFANLVEKRVVSLDDPEFRAMVDSNLAGAELAPSSNTIFFDSLRIDNLSVTMGPDVWLRSSEANIQLDGNIVVSRSFEDNIPRYRIDGTLRALRGNYKLALGNGVVAVTRDFRVTRGEVRFFGTPDFNPEMDVIAEYVARTEQGAPLTVRANIEGTLLYPRLRLSSDANPPLTETEIASYLMFGRAGAPELGLGGAASQAQVIGGSVLSGVGQALVSQLGLPINYLTITPGTGRASSQGGTSSARLEAGAQLNERTFLTLNAGLCEVLTSKLVGVTLEYRLSSMWSASASFEPVIQQCGTVATLANLKTLYQLGFDLFWQQGVR